MQRLIPILLLAAGTLAQGRAATPVRLEERSTASVRPRVTFPQVHFALTATRGAGMSDLGKGARYASVRLGRRTLPLAFDAPKGALVLGRLHTVGGKTTMGVVRPRGKGEVWIEFLDVACAGARVNVGLRYRGLDLQAAVLEPARHRRGRAVIGGAVREVILVDGDGDGRYDGPEDRWIALRIDRLARLLTLKRHETSLLREPQIPFKPNGQGLMVQRVAPDGSSLVLVLGKPTVTAKEVLGRRYEEVREAHYRRFERETLDLKLDRTRPKAKEPVRWLEVLLAEAKKRARRARRPLLVCYFTEATVWYYRYTYYTFPDRDVDALLRRFVCVRIDVEKDPARSYGASGARGLPALVPLTSAGKPVSFRMRNQGADLEHREKSIIGWQRPRDLVVNLKRILEEAK